MSGTRFWGRTVTSPRPDHGSSGLRHTNDPQNSPNPEDTDWRCRPDFEFDALRDGLLTGDDIFDGDLPEPFRRPTDVVLDILADARRAAGASGVPRSLSSSRGASEATLSTQQPGRGRDRAA